MLELVAHRCVTIISMFQIVGITSGIFNALSYVPYIRDILKHTTKPSQASWLIWTILGAIAFFSQLAKGANNSLWLTGVQTCGVGLVFILSLRYGAGGIGKKDSIALCLAAFSLVGWYLTKNAAIALWISIFINATGALLTMDKAYKDPNSETKSTWVLGSISGVCAMIAVGSFNILLLSYPFYIFISNAGIVLAIFFGKKRLT